MKPLRGWWHLSHRCAGMLIVDSGTHQASLSLSILTRPQQMPHKLSVDIVWGQNISPRCCYFHSTKTAFSNHQSHRPSCPLISVHTHTSLLVECGFLCLEKVSFSSSCWPLSFLIFFMCFVYSILHVLTGRSCGRILSWQFQRSNTEKVSREHSIFHVISALF